MNVGQIFYSVEQQMTEAGRQESVDLFESMREEIGSEKVDEILSKLLPVGEWFVQWNRNRYVDAKRKFQELRKQMPEEAFRVVKKMCIAPDQSKVIPW